MRAEAFKTQLLKTIGGPAAQSYVSRCRRIERALELNLDNCDLSEIGISNIRMALKRQMPGSGMTLKGLANCLTAARKYEQFRT